MNRGKGGIHIGKYRITPLGIGVFGAILLAIAIIAVILVMNHISADPTIKIASPGSDKAAGQTGEPVITTYTATPQPTTAPTIEPTPTPEPTPSSARIRFLGEISADENVLSAARAEDGSYDFSEMISTISDAVGGADYTVADVEGSMGGVGEGYKGKGTFNTPESLITNLSNAGVDMLALANDHALDKAFEGLLKTITNCQTTGMEYTGAAASQEEHDTPKIVDINGIKVCFLNYTTTLNSKEKDTSDVAVQYGVNLVSKSNANTDVQKARTAGANVVIAIMSWSEDGSKAPGKEQQQVAKVLVGAGVDVIVGYGPRVTQPVLWLDTKDAAGNAKKTLCVCSVGTFLSDETKNNQDCGTIFELTIRAQEDGTFAIESPTSIPTYVWRNTVENKSTYRVLACGDWVSEKPEGMSDSAYARMQTIWQAMPQVVTSASTVAPH